MDPLNVLPEHTLHPRSFHENVYVYPVLSRRSKGISIGVNLNPDKICNFDCVYCQVDRTEPGADKHVQLDRLFIELKSMLECVTSGELFLDPQFAQVPGPLRRLNDIAFSGDGEPTTEPNFEQIVAQVAELKQSLGLHDVKIVLITNATMFHRPKVQKALDLLMANQGEIWAKLDAGTEAYYHQIERTSVPFQRVLDNIQQLSLRYPLVIQSMFLRYDGAAPSDEEITAYIDRLGTILKAGGRISLAQVYTVARRPAESIVAPLSDSEVNAIAERVRRELSLPAETYYGKDVG